MIPRAKKKISDLLGMMSWRRERDWDLTFCSEMAIFPGGLPLRFLVKHPSWEPSGTKVSGK